MSLGADVGGGETGSIGDSKDPRGAVHPGECWEWKWGKVCEREEMPE